MVPRRIARNVPASISALPATSSSSRRCCGSSEYLIGPKTVECVPRQNSDAKSTGTLPSQSPQAPSDMMPISASLTTRAILDLSIRSASVPEAPEKRKNGAMNSAPASITSDAAPRPDCSARRKVTTIPSALLSRLSLKAPRNCVTNSGAKRRAVSSCSNGERITATPGSDRRYRRPRGGDQTIAHRGQGHCQPTVGDEGHGLEDDAEHERRGEIGMLVRNLLRRNAARDDGVDRIDRRGRSRCES